MTDQSVLKLRTFSTDQLIEELVRRRNERDATRPRHWCEECAHFIPWSNGETPEASMASVPDAYNPCEVGHTMRFQMPKEITDDYGHYRTICADRQPME